MKNISQKNALQIKLLGTLCKIFTSNLFVVLKKKLNKSHETQQTML